MRVAELECYLSRLSSVPGWLDLLDAEFLCAISNSQVTWWPESRLDILEIGVFKGRSAVLLGFLIRPGERLVACDTFLSSVGISTENAVWNRRFYPDLARADFESNYLMYHGEPPFIVAAPSAELPGMLAAGSCRLIHVDGGHDYETVRQDALIARRLLCPGGVVVFDDYCKPHLPGTALAVWEQVLRGGLMPVALTDSKMYCTWDVDQAAAYQDTLMGLAAGRPQTRIDEHQLLDRTVPRIVPRPPPSAWETLEH
jgi:SAM-dependent methyltransferase